ncbi:MAG: DinB family protein [Flavobacteriaceae bacterium]
MNHSKQLAKNFRDLHFGPNFVGSSLKEALEGVDWEQATTRVRELNTIAMLVFHINYYVSAVIKVLKGGPLDAHDKYSYDMPDLRSEADWQKMLDKTWSEAEEFTSLVEKLSEEQLKELMADEKYGNWFRNLLGVQEHSYYHLGQIVLIKKMIQYRPLMV